MNDLDYHNGLIGRPATAAGDRPILCAVAVEATDENERSERHGRSGIHGGKAETRP